MKRTYPPLVFSLLFISLPTLFCPTTTYAEIMDLTEWTLVEDPPHANVSASASSSQITLTADGAVPHATDIGYQSVNGNTAASSALGYVFDPSEDFAISIDYDITNHLGTGGLAIGFGIGEDGDGQNSAGVVLGYATVFSVSTWALSTAARIDDVTQTPTIIGLFSPTIDTFHLSYNAASGDLTVGAGAASSTIAGIQNSWNDQPLIVSLFLRSDQILDQTNGNPWDGRSTTVFSNFSVDSGTPISVPEPSVLVLLSILGVGAIVRRRFHSL